MIDVRTASILDLFRVATEPALVIGVDPYQRKEGTGL
jgi:hypothetical protein